jgi:KUP system potassium uptake protein
MKPHSESNRLATLAVAALGVVYGDIGTSPLYAMKEVFSGAHHPVPVTPDNVLGILSLIFWTLVVIVSLKYASFIMRADNYGEGGIMALLALEQRANDDSRRAHVLVLLGLFGAALFYGDGIITPAISVLSAVEGLGVATPMFKHWVVPITLVVLLGLFAIQKQGTGKVGAWFGPIMGVWFFVLAVLGVSNIVKTPMVLHALLPTYAVSFFLGQPHLAFLSLGAVVLAVTGAEALYADMGHFGRKPVRLAWITLVLPALTLNYFGQGALILADPRAIAHPFYHLAPSWALIPLVILSTAATVIASQAVISGAYSITHQAIQLGYVPRMRVQHTSSRERGQIYLPGVNWALFLAVAALVVSFGSSDNLAAAYGIAVTGTMIITTLLVYVVARRIWGWGQPRALLVVGAFLAVDLTYFSANLVKVVDGGWFPLGFAALLFLLMTNWKRGRALVKDRRDRGAMPLADFLESMQLAELPVVPGTAVFLTPYPAQVPHALLHSIKHYKCLHEHVVIMNVNFLDKPFVPVSKRVRIEVVNERFSRVQVDFGFMDQPNLTKTLHTCAGKGMPCGFEDTTFFLGRETLIPKKGSEMAWWREILFIAQARNAGSPASYFGLPPNRVVELGAQIVL